MFPREEGRSLGAAAGLELVRQHRSQSSPLLPALSPKAWLAPEGAALAMPALLILLLGQVAA